MGFADLSYGTPATTGNQYFISHNKTPDNAGTATALRATANITATTGDRALFGLKGGTFSPTSGAATMQHTNFTWTVNQTSTASGAVKVLDIIPTYTSVLGTVTGISYNPTVTSVTGAHYGFLSVPTASLSGFATATPVSTVDVDGSFGLDITSTSADLTLNTTHFTILVDASGATRTITLPAATGCARRIYTIKKIDASGNVVTIDGNASETIDGATTQPLNTQWEYLKIQSNGTSWFIIGND